MTVLVALVVGVAAGAAATHAMRELFDHEVFARTNHRGRTLPTALGLVPLLVAVAADASWTLAETGPVDTAPSVVAVRHLIVGGVVALGLLGLLDDLAGAGESYGFVGHLRELARGRITTGAIKLFGGGAVGIVVAGGGSVGRVLVDGAVIALAANLANLFDRAPGRTLKVTALGFVGLVAAAGADERLVPVAVAVGAAVALLPADLGERGMLGDAGSNLLGGALGAGVVVTVAPAGRNGVLVALVALNLLSERVSFSRVIDRTPPLRFLDRLGRESGS